ncbi:MAG: glycoside hydrolase family 28 protein [Steroidobacter sp.]
MKKISAMPEIVSAVSRRELLKLVALASASSLPGACVNVDKSMTGKSSSPSSPNTSPANTDTSGWNDYPAILARIKAPTFPGRDFSITQFGAIANSDIDATQAIASAIMTCANAGGGSVIVPSGDFITGPIVLKSNVNLHLLDGATLKFSTDPAMYPTLFTRWEGIECFNYSPLISAFGQENIAITGNGTLDGQASNDNWWNWTQSQQDDQKALIIMGDQGIPVAQRMFGAGHRLRPNFVQLQRCRNILVEGISIRNSPMWELHPVLSSNIIIRGVRIDSHGPNNDGCDPECCRDVLIEDCEFNTGDDCIAIKSGKNNDGRRVNVPSENIIVRNCRMQDGHGGVVLGSECSGNIRNVFIENCTMNSPQLACMLRFKDNAVRGGVLENIFARNITVGAVSQAIVTIDFLYEEGAHGSYKPIVRNVQIDHVRSNASPRVMYIASFPGAEIDQIKFTNCIFKGVESAEVLNASGSVEFHNVVIEPKNKPLDLNTRKAL